MEVTPNSYIPSFRKVSQRLGLFQSDFYSRVDLGHTTFKAGKRLDVVENDKLVGGEIELPFKLRAGKQSSTERGEESSADDVPVGIADGIYGAPADKFRRLEDVGFSEKGQVHYGQAQTQEQKSGEREKGRTAKIALKGRIMPKGKDAVPSKPKQSEAVIFLMRRVGWKSVKKGEKVPADGLGW